MNKIVFSYLISMALITGCTDLPAGPGAGTASVTTPGTTTASVPALGTTNASVPAPEAATASLATPTPENFGLYTDSDLQIYADTLDARIQAALKNNDTSQAQALGLKRQELIAEFNRRGLKRHQVEPNTLSHSPRRVNHRENRVTRPRTKVKPPAPGLPGED
jgi:hypothetical protein